MIGALILIVRFTALGPGRRSYRRVGAVCAERGHTVATTIPEALAPSVLVSQIHDKLVMAQELLLQAREQADDLRDSVIASPSSVKRFVAAVESQARGLAEDIEKADPRDLLKQTAELIDLVDYATRTEDGVHNG